MIFWTAVELVEQTNLRVYFGDFFTVLAYTVPLVLGIDYLTFVVFQKTKSQNLTTEWFTRCISFISSFLGVSTFMHARSFMLNWKQASKEKYSRTKGLQEQARLNLKP